LSYDLLQTVARRIINRPVNLTPDEVTKALDPENFVAVRGILGGPAPRETRRAVVVERDQEKEDEQWYETRQAALQDYPQRLRTAVYSFIPTVP
jgi:argininosuccinate lyase